MLIASQEEIDRLIEVGLLDLDGDSYCVHDFLDYNPAAAQVRKLRKERAKAGAIGGSKRQANVQAIAKPFASAVRKQNSTPSRSRPVPSSPAAASSRTTRARAREEQASGQSRSGEPSFDEALAEAAAAAERVRKAQGLETPKRLGSLLPAAASFQNPKEKKA